MTLKDILKLKGKRKLSMITAYSYPIAKLAADANIDMILVGDSVGTTAMGLDTTLPVTMNDMLLYAKSVKRGAPECFVIGDMPFMSYQISEELALENASRFMKEAMVDAVKIELKEAYLGVLKKISVAGIPVMAHIGLLPQSFYTEGYSYKGKEIVGAMRLIDLAIQAETQGAFSIVLECVPKRLAGIISEKLKIPTIGIGSGPLCDGQVLVVDDMLGLSGNNFKHNRVYAELGDIIIEAFGEYKQDIEFGAFPTDSNTIDIDDSLYEEIEKNIDKD